MIDNENDRWIVLNALDLAIRSHEDDAQTLDQVAEQGGIPNFCTAEAARGIANAHRHTKAEIRRIRDQIEGTELG